MKKILLPYDFTENSEAILNFGIGLAKELSAEIILLNVISYPLVTPEIGLPAFSYKDVIEDSLRELQKIADKLMQSEPTLSKIDCFAEMGDITQTLVDYCAKHPVEFVVMGISHQDNKLMKVLMGSSAIETSHKTKCTVLVVPPNSVYKKPVNIAFASDHKNATLFDSSLEKARSITELLHANLEIIQVVDEHHHFSSEETAVNAGSSIKKEKQTHRLVLVTEKKVSEGLLSMLENNTIDMVIVEPKEHSLFYNLFHESVSKEIAFASSVPVILIHS